MQRRESIIAFVRSVVDGGGREAGGSEAGGSEAGGSAAGTQAEPAEPAQQETTRKPNTAGVLLRRYAGDWRSLLPGTAAGVMQLMYPPLGRAVMEHSEFVADPLGRVYRSVPQIWAMLLAPDGAERGRRIRDVHKGIAGRNDDGSRYHALDPETFWWAHATFTWEIFRSIELFHTRQLNAKESEQLYQDTIGWYEMYGVSMRPVPADLRAFREKFDARCDEVLEITPAARMTLDMTEGRSGVKSTAAALIRAVPAIPSVVARAGVGVTHTSGRVGLIGCLPARLKDRFPDDLWWSPADRARFVVVSTGLRHGFRAVPRPVNEFTMRTALRTVGRQTRTDRYVPQRKGRLAVGS